MSLIVYLVVTIDGKHLKVSKPYLADEILRCAHGHTLPKRLDNY